MSELASDPASTAGVHEVIGLGVAVPWTDSPPEAADWRPGEPGWFDVRTQLAPRGYKYLPSASQYLLAAAKRAFADAGGPPSAGSGESAGVVVGTNHATSALHTAMDETVVSADASALSPVLAPFFSVNVFASRLSLEYDLSGFNVTVTSPGTAGLDAILLGLRQLELGRATRVLVGSAEEVPVAGVARAPDTGAATLLIATDPARPDPARSDPARSDPAGSDPARPESGPATPRSGRPSYGGLSVRSLFAPAELPPDGLRARLAATLDRLGLGASGAPDTILLGRGPFADALGAALSALSAEGATVRRREAGSGSLAPVLELVSVLAAGGPPRLVVACAPTGNVTLALANPRPSRSREPATAGAGAAAGAATGATAGASAARASERS